MDAWGRIMSYDLCLGIIIEVVGLARTIFLRGIVVNPDNVPIWVVEIDISQIAFKSLKSWRSQPMSIQGCQDCNQLIGRIKGAKKKVIKGPLAATATIAGCSYHLLPSPSRRQHQKNNKAHNPT